MISDSVSHLSLPASEVPMPRLLLVDDNPSIHKIAESLLSGSDVQLVCVEGGAQALALVARGEAFDAALIDIFMAGMDGWALLDALRMHPGTAAMPVAMMAGVLDSVDPRRLEQARVQGYVKKPVELRDLPERVRTIIASGGPSSENEPTVAMVSPFATAPAMAVRDFSSPTPSVLADDVLVLTAEDLLEEEDASAASPEGDAALLGVLVETPEEEANLEPALELEPDLEWEGEGTLDDGLVAELNLEEEPKAPLATEEPLPTPAAVVREDLAAEIEAISVEPWAPQEMEPFAAVVEPLPTPAAMVLEDFELEDEAISLDSGSPGEVLAPPPMSAAMVLEDLQLEVEALSSGSVDAFEPEAMDSVEAILAAPPVDGTEDLVPESLETLPEPVVPDTLDTPFGLEPLEDSVELPDLGPSTELFTPHALLDAPVQQESPLPRDWDDSEDLLSAIQAALPTALVPGPGEPLPDSPPTGELISPELEQGVGAAMAAGAAAAAAAAPGSALPLGNADALVEAILADPVALEKLAKALSKHLSQAALRDVAWEVMPDLADRLRPH